MDSVLTQSARIGAGRLCLPAPVGEVAAGGQVSGCWGLGPAHGGKQGGELVASSGRVSRLPAQRARLRRALPWLQGGPVIATVSDRAVVAEHDSERVTAARTSELPRAYYPFWVFCGRLLT